MSSADAYCGRGPNTPAICRKSYVHPEILSAYMSGDLVKMIDAKIARKFKQQYAQLSADEIMVLAEGLPS